MFKTTIFITLITLFSVGCSANDGEHGRYTILDSETGEPILTFCAPRAYVVLDQYKNAVGPGPVTLNIPLDSELVETSASTADLDAQSLSDRNYVLLKIWSSRIRTGREQAEGRFRSRRPAPVSEAGYESFYWWSVALDRNLAEILIPVAENRLDAYVDCPLLSEKMKTCTLRRRFFGAFMIDHFVEKRDLASYEKLDPFFENLISALSDRCITEG